MRRAFREHDQETQLCDSFGQTRIREDDPRRELSRKLNLPKLSRDEIKEGYVNTFGVKPDQLPEDTNSTVNEVFFVAILRLLKGNVSIVIEAAFQHKLWTRIVLARAGLVNLTASLTNNEIHETAYNSDVHLVRHGMPWEPWPFRPSTTGVARDM